MEQKEKIGIEGDGELATERERKRMGNINKVGGGMGERERPREKVNIGLAHISYIFSHLDGPTSDGPSSIIQ